MAGDAADFCVGAADHEAGKAAASTACEPAAAVFSGAWTLLPYYMDCIHSPSYKSENASGGCEVLALSGAGAGTEAWEQYKRTDALVIDPSRCEPFVDVIAPQCKARARLQPISVKLRPNTSDHRVLSQVRHAIPSEGGCTGYRTGDRCSCSLG